ncbi:MAG: dipeptidase [bacterium]
MTVVIDLHCDSLEAHVEGRRDIARRSNAGHLDLPRLVEAGVTAQVFAIWTDPRRYRPGARAPFVSRTIAAFDRLCAGPGPLVPARRPADVRPRPGRVAGILAVEGGHALDGSLASLARFHRRGVRILTLTWNNSNELARSCLAIDGNRRGLTRLGRLAVARMNHLGMVVDLSHAGDRTFADALDASTAPVICSHSGCRARHDFPRNLSDDQLRALGRQGGVVGIVFLPYFLTRARRRATIDDVIDHVCHAAAVAGSAAVGLGSDFDGFRDPPPRGLEDVTCLPALADGLRRRGFSAGEVAGILGGNFLRVWRAVAGA